MIKKTLYFGNPAYLSMHLSQLVIKLQDAEGNTREVTKPIEDLGMIVLDSNQITITQGLLSALLDNNCAVISCDQHHLPTGLFLPLYSNSVQNERFREQLEASLPLKKQLWQQTIQQKIYNQASCLCSCSGAEAGCMFAWAKEVRSGDPENMEGRAAAYYWRNFFPMIDDFVRRREMDSPNNLLNYGYAILRAIIARALVSSGLLPTLGIHHHNRYDAYCLADDIMEPYRPYVDKLVYEIICRHGHEVSLTKEIKAKLLTIPTIDVYINGRCSPLMVAASTTTSSLQKCFCGEIRKIAYPVYEPE